MDERLERCWRETRPPFDGDCLRVPEPVTTARLRALLLVVVDALRAHCGDAEIQRLDDWHEHDGFVTAASPIDWRAIGSMLVSDAALAAGCPEDVSVRAAVYAADGSFLLRFGIEEDGEAPGGDLDVTGSPALVSAVRAAIEERGLGPVVVEPAKAAFDRLYGG